MITLLHFYPCLCEIVLCKVEKYMKKHILFVCALLCVSAIPAGAQKKSAVATSIPTAKEAAPDPQQIYNDHAREIDELKRKHGKSLYVGEGVAESKTDLGEAIRIAKERAMADLLKSIKVRIKADVRDELRFSEDGTASGKFESIVNSYVDQVLEIVRDQRYEGFPKAGAVTEIVYVDKDAYDEKVALDIQEKTDRIKKYALEGAKAQAARNVGQAIENYVNGKIWLKNYFEDLPVKAEIQKAGVPEDLGSYFDTRLTQILHSISLESVDEKIVYNTEGKVSRNPTVIFSYEDITGKTPLADMPANASFVKGKGTISSAPLRSGRRGEVYIPLDWVDPREREASIQVELDAAALRIKDTQGLPVVFIPVNKSKAVAWAVSFFQGAKRENPASLSDSIKMALRSTGYELKAFNISEQEITDGVVKEARSLNVDYIVYTCVIASSRADEYGMYKSVASSKVYIYSFYDDRLVEAIDSPSKTGYSTSAVGAAHDVLAKLKPDMIKTLNEKIKTLK